MKGPLALVLAVLVAAAVFGAEDETLLFGEGEKLYRERKYDLSLERIDAFLKAHPSSRLAPDAWFRRASALYFLGRYRESVELFRRIELRYRSTRFLGLVPFWKGLGSYRMEDYEGAQREFSAFLAEGAEGEPAEQALLYLCLARAALGRYGEAGSALRDLLSTADPGRRVRYCAHIVSVSAENNPDADRELYRPAAETVRRALPAQDPEEDFRYRLVLGEAEARRGRPGEAEALLRPAVAPENAHRAGYLRGLYLRARALLSLGRAAEAAQDADRALSRGGAGDLEAPLLRMAYYAARGTGREEKARQALEAYLQLVPGEPGALLDLARAQAAVRDYPGLAETAGTMLSRGPASGSPGDRGTAEYLLGTAELNRGNYSAASEALGRSLRKEGGLPKEIVPSARFFFGWALYRQARYGEALPALREAARDGYFFRASYYGAWCAYSLKLFPETAGILEEALRRGEADGGPVLRRRSVFLLGQTYGALERFADAAREYRRLFTADPGLELAPEAHFEYAAALAASGDVNAAAGEYRKIPGLYPSSALGESALMRRGELLYAAGRWAEARGAFHDYRSAYPAGRHLDQALYWGALAAAKAGERHGALLLLENLTEKWTASPLRPSALREAAEIHIGLGDLARGAEMYREILSRYPVEAAGFGAEKRLQELRLMAEGAAEREAALLVEARRAGGAATPEGRRALLELAVFYAGRPHPVSEKARPLLDDLRGRTKEDPGTAARAEYLLAGLSRRARNFEEAAAHYLAAASIAGAEPDLVARSLLGAAETMTLAARPDEADRLARLLRKNFPGTDWAAEGEKYLRGDR